MHLITRMSQDFIGTAEVKETIRELLLKLEPDQVSEVKEWFIRYVEDGDNGGDKNLKQDQKKKKILEQRAKKLDKIAVYLREQVKI